MDKQTSSRVSTIAAKVLRAKPRTVGDASEAYFNELLADAKILAGSCMSQDETPGQGPVTTFLDRLKTEHAQLSGRHDALTLTLSRETPQIPPKQRKLLEAQFIAMTEYRRILEMRLALIDTDTSVEDEADGA